MKVKELINELKKYDLEKPVCYMSESQKRDEDITYAYDIHRVEQRALTQDDFEMRDDIFVILLNINDL